jgi:hypothetical protein
MRHLGSLLAGLVIAPLAWVLLAFGQTRVYAYWSPTAVDHNYPWIEPILYLVAAGLLVGLLASTRISPVGPLVAGAAYLAAGVAGLASASAAKLLPHLLTISGRRADLRLPVGNGTAIVLGAAMLVAVVSASRWRRWPVAPARAEVGGPQPAVEPGTVEPGTVEPAPETVQAGPGAAAAGAGTLAAVPGTPERRSGEEPDRGAEAPAAREGDTRVIRQEPPGAYPPGPSSPPPASWPPVSPGAEMAAGPRHAARDAAGPPVPAGEEPVPTDEEPGSGPGPSGAVGVARVDAEPADAERARAERDAMEAAAARAEAERRAAQRGSAASAEVAGNSPWARPPSANREPPQRPAP